MRTATWRCTASGEVRVPERPTEFSGVVPTEVAHYQRLCNAATRRFRLRKMTVEVLDREHRGNPGIRGTCSLDNRIRLYAPAFCGFAVPADPVYTLAHEIAHQKHRTHGGWHRRMTERIWHWLAEFMAREAGGQQWEIRGRSRS